MPHGLLEEGARNVVDVCLDVAPDEAVVVVTDQATYTVGRAIADAAGHHTDDVTLVDLDTLGERPMTEVPPELRELAEGVDVSVWAAASVQGELPMRMAYGDLVRAHARHGHMPGVTEELMRTGMCADYDEVAELTVALHERLQGVEEVRVTGPHGTDLIATLDLDRTWIPDTGLLHETGDWGNLPAGEVFTAPATLEGHLVTSLLGDWFSEGYGPLEPRLELDIVGSRVDLDSIRGGPEGLVEDLRDYLTTEECSARVGEFALGTNLALREPVGNLLQDEKIPGVHVAFGNPYPEQTGAGWSCSTHVDAIVPGASAWLDGAQVLDAGRYLL